MLMLLFMSLKSSTSQEGAAAASTPQLAEDQAQIQSVVDVFFGGFCVLMLLVGVIGWRAGDFGALTPVAIAAFLVGNVILSQVSVRVKNPYRIEVARIVAGTVLAPGAFLLVSGAMAPWWPGFLIMCLGGTILIGLMTGNPTWGRGLVTYYVGLLLATTIIAVPHPNWYQTVLDAAVIAMVGLLFAQIMSVLGQTLQKVHERTVELQKARDALFAEVEVAHEIQTLLLPTNPEIPENLIRGKMIPADEVGGDYYDVIEMKDGRTFLAVGDVSGHGVTSGLTMMMARSSLLGILEANPKVSLADAYRVLNRALRDNLERMKVHMYMTFALIEYRGDGEFAAVGRHLPFMIYRRQEERVEEIDLEGMWLGVIDDLSPNDLSETRFRLEPGELMVLYTDGIVEHFRGDEMFGFDRLRAIVRNFSALGADAVISETLAALDSFAPDVDDDVTLMVVDHHGKALAADQPMGGDHPSTTPPLA